MRVLQIISTRDINGAVIHCQSLMEQLEARGHQMFVACPEDSWIAAQTDPRRVLPTSLDRWPLTESRRVAAAARDLGIEVTHSHQSRAHSFGVMLRLLYGIPSVATAHNRRIQLHWALNDHVIGVSQRTTAYHRRFNLVSRHRSTTIHNFVDSERFAASRADRRRLRARFGMQGRLVVTMVGTVTGKKGIHVAVESLPTVLRAAPEVMLQVVGCPRPRDRAYAQQVLQRAADLGVAERVCWAGRCDDIPDRLAASDLFLSASFEENLPISILEAMAARLPVIATRVGGVAECVSDGETGRLVPPRSVAALSAALTELCCGAAQRERLGEAGRRRVRQRFSPATQVAQIEAVLRRAASAVRRRSAEPPAVERPAVKAS